MIRKIWRGIIADQGFQPLTIFRLAKGVDIIPIQIN